MTDPRRFGRATFTLIFAAMVVYLVGNADVPLWDRDEPRYAQCSSQMLSSGDWVLPMYLDDLRIAKPPMIYWLQASSMKVFGVNEFAARFPSAVAMGLTLLVVAVTVRRAIGIEHAFWTVLVLASSTMIVLAAKACLTDSVLLLFITCGQFCVYRICRNRLSWRLAAAFGLFLGLALLTKGPVALAVPAVSCIAYALLSWSVRRSEVAAKPDASAKPPRERWLPLLLKVGLALAVAIAVCVPWVVSIERRWAELPASVRVGVFYGSGRKSSTPLPSDVHGGYVWNVLDKEVFHRTTTAQEGHAGPPGYYLAAIWGVFLPWSLILPAAVVVGWRRRHEKHVRFALAALAGPWVMFEALKTKLPHYLLPCFVPLAFLSADVIVQCLRHGATAFSNKHFRRGAVAWAIVLSIGGLAPWLFVRWFAPQPAGPVVVLSVVAIGYAVWVAVTFLKSGTQRALVAIGVGGLLVFAIVFRVYLPSCQFLKVSPAVAGVLQEHGVTRVGQALMLDYKEPSLAFYQRGAIRENSAVVLTSKLLDETSPTAWFVVTKEVWDNASTARDRLDVIASVPGLDIADGMRPVEVMVLRRKQ